MGEDPLNDGRVLNRGDELHPPGSAAGGCASRRWTATGSPYVLETGGLHARVIQHEMDHLDGILFIDRLPPVQRDRIKKKIQKEGFPKELGRHAFAL